MGKGSKTIIGKGAIIEHEFFEIKRALDDNIHTNQYLTMALFDAHMVKGTLRHAARAASIAYEKSLM